MADECLAEAVPALRGGRRLRELFDACAEHGTISFDDDTCIFAGQLG
jgi:hypothetical protein